MLLRWLCITGGGDTVRSPPLPVPSGSNEPMATATGPDSGGGMHDWRAWRSPAVRSRGFAVRLRWPSRRRQAVVRRSCYKKDKGWTDCQKNVAARCCVGASSAGSSHRVYGRINVWSLACMTLKQFPWCNLDRLPVSRLLYYGPYNFKASTDQA
jgi:hypothetical protein